MTRLEAAMAYVNAGFFIAPVEHGTKNPGSILGPSWETKTSKDPADVERWWTLHPNADIALHVGRSGCVAFDLDCDDLSTLPEPFRSELPSGLFQRTRRRGDRGHYLFRLKRGESYGNSAPKEFAPFGELRCRNGVIIVEPSFHATKGKYHWPSPGVVPLLPPALRERLTACQDYEPAMSYAELDTFLDSHAANDRPDLFGGMLETLRRDLDEGRRSSRHATFTAVLAMAMEESAAGAYPARDAYEAIRDRYAPAYAVPGRKPHGNEWPGMVRWAAAQARAADPEKTRQRMNRDSEPVDDSEFWESRPLLRDLREFARSRRVGPWAMFGAVVARSVGAVPPAVVLPALVGSQASLNLFVALVGPSGSGKGAAEQAANDFIDTDPIVETATVGSGEGLAKLYAHKVRGEQVNERTAVLFTVPEVDNLVALTARQGATLLPQLRSAWSGERLGFSYADPAKTVRIERHRYRMTLILGVQPDRAAPLIDDADGGTPQRFLWFPTTDPEAPNAAPDSPPQWSIPPYADAPGGLDFLSVPIRAADLVEIDLPDEAVQFIADGQLAKLRGKTVKADLDGHSCLARLKVAAALMVLDSRFDKVDPEDWDLAGVVCAVSDRTRAQVQRALGERASRQNVTRGRAEGERAVAAAEVTEEATLRRVADNIRRHLERSSPQSKRDLKKRHRLEVRPQFDAALERLIAAGVVRESEGSYELS